MGARIGNRGLTTGKLNETVFNYEIVIFHSGNRKLSEYLRQREFYMGNDYIGDGIAEKSKRR